jgi:hypothetical protein
MVIRYGQTIPPTLNLSYIALGGINNGTAQLEFYNDGGIIFMFAQNTTTMQEVYQYIDIFGYNFATTLGPMAFMTDNELLQFTNTFLISSNSDIEIIDKAMGIIIHSPDDSRWRITISNLGVLSATKL